jgi:hypothetical protein
MTLALALAQFRRAVLAAVAIVSGAMIGAGILRFGLGHDSLFGFAPKFNPFIESSIHTWLSSALLLLCGLMLILIGLAKRREASPFAWHWITLGVGFLLLSLDETAMIHEMAGGWFDKISGKAGPDQFWALLAAPLGLVLLFSYWRFIMHLPSDFRRSLFVAAACFVGGALGMEAIAGLVIVEWHPQPVHMYSMATVEESLELFGVGWFLCAVAEYVATGAGIGVRLHQAPAEEAAA